MPSAFTLLKHFVMDFAGQILRYVLFASGAFLLYAGTAFTAVAQKSELNNSYVFKEGIYLSYHEFVKDSPSLSFDDVSINELEGSEYNFRIYEIAPHNDTLVLRRHIWGICVEGKPYLNNLYSDEPIKFSFGAGRKVVLGFSRIQTIGTICLYAATQVRRAGPGGSYMMFGLSAYVASNARYDASSYRLCILDLRTGTALDFTDENLLEFIADDEPLCAQLRAAKKPKEQMFIVLRKYNELYPVYVAN